MTEIAEAARGLPDARVRKLVDWIRENMCPDLPPLGTMQTRGPPARWNDTRVIIFTEYDDTKRYLQQQLAAAIATTDRADERIAIYHGPTPPAEREEIKRAFTTDPKKHPVRILIATDAAREGLNLQTHCWNLFHFDVPWNPSRMEQRNGRIDRKLQPSAEVYCHYFVYTEREEDRILAVLVRKTETIKKELGSLSQVLEGRLARTLKQGIRHRDIAALAKELEGTDLDADNRQVVEEELEAARERQEDLKAQIERLQNRLKASQDWLALREDHFRSAISCALQLMHADPLKPLPRGDDWDKPIERFEFPALDQRQGADPTWAETMDTLRAPAEARSEALGMAPGVADPAGRLRRHRHDGRGRRPPPPGAPRRPAAARPVHRPGVRPPRPLPGLPDARANDAIPRVILLGRLCLYGPRAARLHEELVPVTARWIELSQRKQRPEPLRPGGRGEDPRPPRDRPAADGSHRTSIPSSRRSSARPPRRDIAELLPHLEQRGKGARRGGPDRSGQAGGAGSHGDEDDPGRAEEAGGRDRRRSTETRSSCSTSTTTSSASSNPTSGTGRSGSTRSTRSWPPSPSASGRSTKSRPSGSSRSGWSISGR